MEVCELQVADSGRFGRKAVETEVRELHQDAKKNPDGTVPSRFKH
jgi:hypothetical protein